MENMREIIEFQVMTTFCRGGKYYVAAAPLLILRSWPPLQTGFDSFPSAWLGWYPNGFLLAQFHWSRHISSIPFWALYKSFRWHQHEECCSNTAFFSKVFLQWQFWCLMNLSQLQNLTNWSTIKQMRGERVNIERRNSLPPKLLLCFFCGSIHLTTVPRTAVHDPQRYFLLQTKSCRTWIIFSDKQLIIDTQNGNNFDRPLMCIVKSGKLSRDVHHLGSLFKCCNHF